MNNVLGKLRLSFSISNPARMRGMCRRSSSLVDPTISYKVGFMFPGQGAQSVGMAGTLCNEIPEAKQLFDCASEILKYDLLQKCVDGPKDSLDSTIISQPAIFVSSMACVEKLRKENPAAIDSCTVAMGLSLGEYSALCFAGAFSFEDGVRLTKVRGEAMQTASNICQSGMVAIIGLESVAVQKICEVAKARSGEPIGIANYLSEGNYAVSGGKAACAVVIEVAPSMGARMTVPLSVAGAFHTAYMQPAVASLHSALEDVHIRTPRIPVISNIDARAYYDPMDIRSALVQQVTRPVQWESTMRAMLTSPDFERAYELGPGSVCRGIVKRFNKRANVVGVQA